MKRLFKVFIALTLMLSLVACSTNAAENNGKEMERKIQRTRRNPKQKIPAR